MKVSPGVDQSRILAAPHFQNDDDARRILRSILWPNGPVCPHCGSIDRAYPDKRRVKYRCANKGCRKEFTVTMRTVMERSKVASHKWLQGFYLMTSSKRPVSAYHLHRTLDIGYEAAWFMHYRIREAMRGAGLSLGTPVGCSGGAGEAGAIDRSRRVNATASPRGAVLARRGEGTGITP